jgi:hypothetical protein
MAFTRKKWSEISYKARKKVLSNFVRAITDTLLVLSRIRSITSLI